MKRLITLCLLGGCFYLLPHRIMYPKPGWPTKAMGPTKISPVCGLLRSGRLPCRRRLLFDLIQFQLFARFTNITLQRPCQLDYHRCGCTLRTAPVTDVRLNMATVYGHPVSATITVNSIYSGVTRTKEHSW